jgi:hypothetical protein
VKLDPSIRAARVDPVDTTVPIAASTVASGVCRRPDAEWCPERDWLGHE